MICDCSQTNQVGNNILCTKPRHQIRCKFSECLKLPDVVIFYFVLEEIKLAVSLLPSNQAKSSTIPENIRSIQVVTFVARWHARYLQHSAVLTSQGAQTCLATGQPGERGTRDKPVALEPPVDSD